LGIPEAQRSGNAVVLSGARVAVQMHHRCPLGNAARVFTIDFGLLLTEGVAFGQVARPASMLRRQRQRRPCLVAKGRI